MATFPDPVSHTLRVDFEYAMRGSRDVCQSDSNNQNMRRLLLLLSMPAGVLALTFVLWQWIDELPEPLLAMVAYLPYGIAVLGVILAWVFNRSRVLFLSLVVVATHAVVHQVLPHGGPGRFDAVAIYEALCLLVPINFVIFASLSERGVWTGRGALRIGFLFLQGGLVAWLGTTGPSWVHALAGLRLELIPSVPDSPMPQLAWYLFLLAGLVILVRLVIHRSALEAGFLGALMALGISLHLAADGPGSSVFAAAAALSLIIAVIQDSYQMAYRDDLTELPARRALREDLMKLGTQYAFAMVDVDHFKQINDRYGHDAGDQVLRMVATRLARVSGGGRAYRYGGEEFTLVFPGKGLHEVVPHLDALCRTIAETPFTIRSKNRPERRPEQIHMPQGTPPLKEKTSSQVSVTVSIGSAEHNDQQDTPAEVLRAADRSLYWAKKLGRNRVCS